MIDDDFRYFSIGGAIIPGTSTWHIADWDQRRIISVTMDGKQDDESLAIEQLCNLQRSDPLPFNVYRIYVSHSGEIISMYADPMHDETFCVHYPFLHEASLPKGIQTIRRDELEELERLSPEVDLVAYPACSNGSTKKVRSTRRQPVIVIILSPYTVH